MVMEFRLQDLVSPQQAKVLDAIEELQSCGINKAIPSLQVIVGGEKCAGKSSLLAALSGIPFASRSTRFPVEIVLQRVPRAVTNVRIIPHSSRSVEEQKKLATFSPSIIALDDASHLQNLFNEAAKAMDLSTSEDALAKDILRFSIKGPQCPHLKLIDLPGFNSSETAPNSNEASIQKVVQGYLKDHPSIVLAVVSTETDYKLQNVVNWGQAVPNFERNAMGVITKPDKLCLARSRGKKYLKMVQDELVKFDLGWQIVYTACSAGGTPGSQKHNEESEAKYFHHSIWAGAKSSRFDMGISTLVSRIQDISSQKMKHALRPLIDELAEELDVCEKKLTDLGPERQTEEQQVKYLAKCSQDFCKAVADSADGKYDVTVAAENNLTTRIREICGRLGRHYGRRMEQHGRLHRIWTKMPYTTPRYGQEKQIQHKNYIAKIQKRIESCQVRSLPDAEVSDIVVELFREESSLWEGLTKDYIASLSVHTLFALKGHLDKSVVSASRKAIMDRFVQPKLEKLKSDMRARLADLLRSIREGPAISFVSTFQTQIVKVKSDRASRNSPGTSQYSFCWSTVSYQTNC